MNLSLPYKEIKINGKSFLICKDINIPLEIVYRIFINLSFTDIITFSEVNSTIRQVVVSLFNKEFLLTKGKRSLSARRIKLHTDVTGFGYINIKSLEDVEHLRRTMWKQINIKITTKDVNVKYGAKPKIATILREILTIFSKYETRARIILNIFDKEIDVVIVDGMIVSNAKSLYFILEVESSFFNKFNIEFRDGSFYIINNKITTIQDYSLHTFISHLCKYDFVNYNVVQRIDEVVETISNNILNEAYVGMFSLNKCDPIRKSTKVLLFNYDILEEIHRPGFRSTGYPTECRRIYYNKESFIMFNGVNIFDSSKTLMEYDKNVF